MKNWFNSEEPSFEEQVADVVADPAYRLTQAKILHALDDLLGLRGDESEAAATAQTGRKSASDRLEAEVDSSYLDIVDESVGGECLDGAEISQWLSVGQLPSDRQKHLSGCRLCGTLVACAKSNADRADQFAVQLASPTESAADVSRREEVQELRERQRAALQTNLEIGNRFKVVEAPQPESVRSPKPAAAPDETIWDKLGGVVRPIGVLSLGTVLGSLLTAAFVTRSTLIVNDKVDLANAAPRGDAAHTVLRPIFVNVGKAEDEGSHNFKVGQQAKVYMTGDAEVVSSDANTVQWEVADATLSAEPTAIGSAEGLFGDEAPEAPKAPAE